MQDMIAGAINVLTASITDGAEGVRRALAQLASSFISRIFPGPIGGALGGLVGALINRQGGKKLDIGKVEGVVRTFPANLSMMMYANPASALYSRRALGTGAAFAVKVDYAPGAEHMVRVKMNQGLGWDNYAQGVDN